MGNSTLLTAWAEAAMQLFRQDSPASRADAVACTVGRQAKRIGMTETQLSKWFQNSYGRIWVGADLNPGLDASDVRSILLTSYRKPITRFKR